MNRFLQAFFLLVLISSPFAYSSLLYSTLNLTATDQGGNPLSKAEFFLSCKMSFATPERFLCATDSSGNCLSPCMDCAPGVSAVVRGKYLNHTIEKTIPSWGGTGANCTPYSEPYNGLEIFAFEISEEERGLSKNETDDEIDTASENIPINTNIETKDFHLDSEDSNESSYSGPSEAQDVKTGEICPFAFLLPLLALIASKK